MCRPARPEPPCPQDFTVLAQVEHFIVLDKPAGLPMHASARFFFNTLTRVVAERFPDQNLQICHRLDRETSGCVVLARGKEELKAEFGMKRQALHAAEITFPHPATDEPTTVASPLPGDSSE